MKYTVETLERGGVVYDAIDPDDAVWTSCRNGETPVAVSQGDSKEVVSVTLSNEPLIEWVHKGQAACEATIREAAELLESLGY